MTISYVFVLLHFEHNLYTLYSVGHEWIPESKPWSPRHEKSLPHQWYVRSFHVCHVQYVPEFPSIHRHESICRQYAFGRSLRSPKC